jgi:RNA polymerase sigma factor (TIGR02999 family)
MSDVTRILCQIESGDSHAASELLSLVYDELRKLAAHQLTLEKSGQTLQATALVHEAYLRLVDVDKVQHWNSRGHFFAAAAEAMRRILIDVARSKASLKRGGQFSRIDLSPDLESPADDPVNLLALDEALQKLEADYPDHAAIIKLRFFAGLTLDEAARAAGVSRATAERRWAYARAWLFGQLHPG